MNRCRNKRWMALFSSAIMILMMLFSAVPVYAELGGLVGDTAYIEKVKVIKPEDTTSNVYNIDVSFIGYEDEYKDTIAILASCTVEATDVDGMTASVSKILDESKDKKDVKDSKGDTRTVCRYTITFERLKVPFGSNTFAMTITRNDGKSVHFAKDFDYLGSGGGSGGGIKPGTGDDDDDDDDKETPIAALKPHLIVDSYSYGEAIAGQDIPVTFTLKNTSSTKAIRNVVLTVKPAGDLRIKSASDTIYIDGINPGGTVTKSMKFFLGANATAEVQEIGITSTFEYYDIEGQNAVSGGDSITISIPADTVERVRIQKVEMPEMIYPESEEEVTYSVINAGFNTLYNCEIRVVDEQGTEYAYAYIGSLEPSKAASETYLPIVFKEPGEKKLKFVFSYENNKLETNEATRDFTVTVMEMPVYEDPIIDPFPVEPMPEQQQGWPLWLWLVVIGGGVVVAVVVTVIIVKAVKKKRSEQDDEDI